MIIKIGDRYLNLMFVRYIESMELIEGGRGLRVYFEGGDPLLLNDAERMIFESTLSTMAASAVSAQMQMLSRRGGM